MHRCLVISHFEMHQFRSIDVRVVSLCISWHLSHGIPSIGGQNQLGGHLLLHWLGKLSGMGTHWDSLELVDIGGHWLFCDSG